MPVLLAINQEGAPGAVAGGVVGVAPGDTGAAGTGWDVQVKLSVPVVPPVAWEHRTTCLAATSMNHAEVVLLVVLVPDGADVPISGMNGIELELVVVAGVCAKATAAGSASVAKRR